MLEIRNLIVMMAEENSTWGYCRIQGALKNLGHQVAASTVRNILKENGLQPAPNRPTSAFKRITSCSSSTLELARFALPG